MVTEESVKETVKTIAQGMPDDCGVPLVANACAFLLHRRPRVQRAPGIPCALGFFDGHASRNNSGAARRGNAETRLTPLSCPASCGGIQYAAASRFKHKHLWTTGSPRQAGRRRRKEWRFEN